MSALLEINNLRKVFGGLKAVDNASITVVDGELVGLVGPNGSGKTTLINLLTGYYVPDGGQILLLGDNIAGLAPNKVFRKGVTRMFQHSRVFHGLTARENLLACGFAAGLNPTDCTARSNELLADLGLTMVADEQAVNLSGGQRKLVEFGSCFMGEPRLVVLDEPFAAIHPSIKDIMAGYIQRRNASGQAFLVVSHDIPFIVNLCPRTVVMSNGAVIAEGPTNETLRTPQVIEAYLGAHAVP